MAGGRRLLHAITRVDAKVGGEGLEVINTASLRAVCSAANEEVEGADTEWLAAAARRHHEIIQQLFESATVLPVRFGTLIDDGALRALLEREATGLEAELARLEGLAEWGAKLIADPATLANAAEQSSEALHELDAQLRASTPGKAYLLSRRRETAVSEAVEQHAAAIIQQVRSELEARAVAVADLPLPAISVAPENVLANLAFLVPRNSTDNFATAADQAARDAQISLELSGPWPPYSFVNLNVGGDDG